MEDRNAYKLAEAMHGTWPGNGPTRAAWYDLLKDRDEAAATVAFHAVRSGSNRNVLAAFNEEYFGARRLQSGGSSQAPPEYCVLCDGCGTISVPPEQAHDPRVCHPTAEHPCGCHAVRACFCKSGQGMAGVLHRMREFSDRNRAPHAAPVPAAEQPTRLQLMLPEVDPS